MPFWINRHEFHHLKGGALRKTVRLVNKNGAINISGGYCSIMIDSQDLR
jgi:hypothetical protein